jgi:hypothetical protein
MRRPRRQRGAEPTLRRDAEEAMHPLLILAIGVFSIIFLIAVLRLNAFLARSS